MIAITRNLILFSIMTVVFSVFVNLEFLVPIWPALNQFMANKYNITIGGVLVYIVPGTVVGAVLAYFDERTHRRSTIYAIALLYSIVGVCCLWFLSWFPDRNLPDFHFLPRNRQEFRDIGAAFLCIFVGFIYVYMFIRGIRSDRARRLANEVIQTTIVDMLEVPPQAGAARSDMVRRLKESIGALKSEDYKTDLLAIGVVIPILMAFFS